MTAVSETATDEALEWLVELDAGDVSAEEHARFIRWLNESPTHREAFEALQRRWRQMDVAQRLRTEKVDVDVVGKWLQRRNVRRRLVPLAIAATAAAAAFALWLVQVSTMYEADYLTTVGEQRVVSLPDDSRITLNTSSNVAVRYTGEERRVRLLAGQAHFEVAPDSRRPFLVVAGSGTVRAVGTAFAVYLKGDTVEVTVAEGTVEVLPPAARGAAQPASSATLDEADALTRVLTTRQKLRYRNDTIEAISTVTANEIERELAWRDGMLDFESTPLSDVIAEAARYTRDELIIVDPELESLEFTGYFRAGDVALLMQLLESNEIIDARRVDHDTVHIAKAVSPRNSDKSVFQDDS